MAENNDNRPATLAEVEELAFETRFLVNVLVDLLIKKKLISEEEFSKLYDDILNESSPEKK